MTFVYADQGEKCSVHLLSRCGCPFWGSSCTAFTEPLVRTANEGSNRVVVVGEPHNDMDEPFLLGKEMGSCREKAGMGWSGGVCVWCLLQALVSATLLLPISDKLLSFSDALPTFKW